MTRLTSAGAVALLLAGLSAGRAQAQVVGPRVGALSTGPTFSPYLNLLRNPNSPTLNYYGLVRPQVQTYAGLRALQQFALSQGTSTPAAGAADDTLVTGHVAVFMNTGGYFMSAVGAAPARSVAGPRPGVTASTPATRLPRPGTR
jgi:hypothetical protein